MGWVPSPRWRFCFRGGSGRRLFCASSDSGLCTGTGRLCSGPSGLCSGTSPSGLCPCSGGGLCTGTGRLCPCACSGLRLFARSGLRPCAGLLRSSACLLRPSVCFPCPLVRPGSGVSVGSVVLAKDWFEWVSNDSESGGISGIGRLRSWRSKQKRRPSGGVVLGRINDLLLTICC